MALPVVLFLTQSAGKDEHSPAQCGIGITGQLTSNLLKGSKKYTFKQCFIDSLNDLTQALEGVSSDPPVVAIIYNYHEATTPWVFDQTWRQAHPKILHLLLHYNICQWWVDNYHDQILHGFTHILTADGTLQLSAATKDHFHCIPHSLPCDGLFINCPDDPLAPHVPTGSVPKIPKIGFQGFGFPHKGIVALARRVQEEFDEAILRLHLPFSHFGDPQGTQARDRLHEVVSLITKPGIRIEVTHKFMDPEGIVRWLHDNDLNCYFYDYLDNCGVATSPDYALAAGKPLAVTRSFRTRNYWHISPSILIDDTSLKTIISNGVEPLRPLYQAYSNRQLIQRFEQIIDQNLV